MKTKSLSFMGIILATVLLSSTFLVSITVSEFPSDPLGAYSIWADLNDDGAVDIFDIVWMAGRYGTTGTPVNKTQLLLDLLQKIDQLNTTIIEQQDTINLLNSTVNYLNTTVINLNETVTILNSTGLGAPDYDSGWMNIDPGQRIWLRHGLNTTDLLVYMIGSEGTVPVMGGIHQSYYGGVWWDPTYAGHFMYCGAFWSSLNSTDIKVTRTNNDNQAASIAGIQWNSIRVIIWKIPEP